ncbi:MAG: hypothetical protein C0407_00545 [Desulfobacca sp.]|nr:hypothetical protein [Desulfobacca sp.]
MDAIIIADSGSESVSVTTQMKLTVDDYIANIQVIKNYINNGGRIIPPIIGDGESSWASSLKLNGIFLYSYLSGQGYDIGLIDSYFDERDRFLEMLRHSPKVVVISTTFIMNKKTLNRLVRDIKSVAPGIFIIAGGQFVLLSHRIRERLQSENSILDIYRDDFLFLDERDEPEVDLYIISPCGETILSTALMMVKEGKKPNGLSNTATYRGKRYAFSDQVDDLVTTGGISVDWKRMPKEFFTSGVVPMQASYGCPYHCAFCNFMKDRRLMGVKPLHTLIDELKTVQERGAKYIWFVDDNFRLGKKDLEMVCQEFLNQGVKVKWKSFIRASAMKDLDMDLLRAAGCFEVQFGLESADPELLSRMNKKTNPKLYAEVIERLLRAGIHCSCYFIFGFPGETEKTIFKTREFIKSIEHPELEGIIYFALFPFIIAPLSPISEPKNAQKFGLKGYMHQWEHKTMNFKQAMDYAIRTFFELETSGIIYQSDNLDMLHALAPRHRKEFIARRHQIAKKAAKEPLTERGLLQSFKDLLLER